MPTNWVQWTTTNEEAYSIRKMLPLAVPRVGTTDDAYLEWKNVDFKWLMDSVTYSSQFKLPGGMYTCFLIAYKAAVAVAATISKLNQISDWY